MGTRIKPAPLIVGDLKQVESALAEMAELDRKLGSIEMALNGAIDAVKQKAGADSAPLLARRKELADAVGTFATLNRNELFRDRKSLELSFGVIGFRQSTQIVQLNKITREMTLEKLQEYGFDDGLRVKLEINREGMAGWPEERLCLVGLKRRQTDTFFIEIKAEELVD